VLRQHTLVKRAPTEPAAEPLHRAPVTKAPPLLPVRTKDATSDVRALAVVAAIDVEVRADLGRPLGGIIRRDLRHLLAANFPDVTDLRLARMKSPAAWVEAGAGPGLIAVLFPHDRAAVEQAKKQKNAVQMRRRIELGSEIGRFVSDKGIRPGRRELPKRDGAALRRHVTRGRCQARPTDVARCRCGRGCRAKALRRRHSRRSQTPRDRSGQRQKATRKAQRARHREASQLVVC
jgi:CBS domain-containing protein